MKCKIVVILLTGCMIAADARENAAKKDSEKLQGTWHPVTMEMAGVQVPPEQLKKAGYSFTFAARKVNTHEGTSDIDGSYTLDAGKEPKAITFTWIRKDTAGGQLQAEVTVPAIYEFDGKRLKICMGEGKVRPTEFKTTKENRFQLIVFERTKE